MNQFLTPITQVIHDQRGTIDKYMGDAVMAFWGAPFEDPQHSRHAVIAGLKMIETVRNLGAEFEARGWPPVMIGVGVASGEMNVGNMGSEFRMAYTVMGDVVNLGSRLEGLTKQYGVDMIVSEATATELPDIAFRELDLVRVKGKREPIAIFEPLCGKEALTSGIEMELEQFGEALRAYRACRWEDAASLLGDLIRINDLPLYGIYRQRVAQFRAEPPPEDWDGVFVHQTK